MKKYIAFLLCCVMTVSLFSCTVRNTVEQSTEFSEDYGGVLTMYRVIIENLSDYIDSKDAMDGYCAELGIVDGEEKALFEKLFVSTFDLKKSSPYKLSCGYATKDLNGDGVDELVLLNDGYTVIAVFSHADGKPVLLGNYTARNRCWIDANGWLHENGSNGAAHSTNAVYKIAVGGASLELLAEFGTNGYEWIDDVGVTKYYQSVNGEKTDVTEAEYHALEDRYGKYLGYDECAEATEKYSGLTFTSLYTETDIAKEMYAAVLRNEVKVYDTVCEQFVYLKDCDTPYNRIPLDELDHLEYAYMDVDGDAINEFVIDCGDTLILRYYEGTVYLYSFTFRQLYYLNTDGSHAWNNTDSDFEYGENQIAFDGIELKEKELYRVVNDGEPNAEYYIGDKQVTQEEVLKYIEDNPKTRIEFSPLKVSWLNKISRFDAIEIAEKYWENFDIEENGYRVECGVNSWAPNSVYVIIIRRYAIDHCSTFDEIWVDKNTGETIIPYSPDGK